MAAFNTTHSWVLVNSRLVLAQASLPKSLGAFRPSDIKQENTARKKKKTQKRNHRIAYLLGIVEAQPAARTLLGPEELRFAKFKG